MIRMVVFLFSIITASFCHSQDNVAQGVDGKYLLEQYGEKLIDGSQVHITYHINIDNNATSASIKLTAWHAPITCEGNYAIRKQGDVYSLSFIGDNESCIYPSPQYEIMKKNKNLYMRGSAIAYNQEGWVKLTSKK